MIRESQCTKLIQRLILLYGISSVHNISETEENMNGKIIKRTKLNDDFLIIVPSNKAIAKTNAARIDPYNNLYESGIRYCMNEKRAEINRKIKTKIRRADVLN